MNMNMHGMGQNPMAMPGMACAVSPVMMQASPQHPGNIMQPGPPVQMQQHMPNAMQQQQQTQQQSQQQQQQQQDKIDSISKMKSLLPPLKESCFLTLRAAAVALQQNNLADNLKRDANATQSTRYDKHLEDFTSYCNQIELQLKTAIQCTQQLSSTQHYMPNAVANNPYMQDNPNGTMPYAPYLNAARAQVQSAKDIHDTLISAAQNISQAD